ncbi:hypothetical protein D7Z54_01735 [Salibacterium salarium]|uniref:Uncharacterized protein n=1 Tax=Salibacterium salarium TaxID=284579 RepID=A0A3R9QPC3_9BACI|nr:hypothetical protein [Salibacterium salarium]RSL35312.1 hypothetical protein D7Z54_01735 [Salibacterium salarium]
MDKITSKKSAAHPQPIHLNKRHQPTKLNEGARFIMRNINNEINANLKYNGGPVTSTTSEPTEAVTEAAELLRTKTWKARKIFDIDRY